MSFAGKRAIGCVTYLRDGTEVVLQEAKIRQRWTDQTPLLIAGVEWNNSESLRYYLLEDSRQTRRWVRESDLAEAPNE